MKNIPLRSFSRERIQAHISPKKQNCLSDYFKIFDNITQRNDDAITFLKTTSEHFQRN